MFNTVYSALYSDYAHLRRFSNHAETVVSPEEIIDPKSILILHGGEDISPTLYGQKPNHYTSATQLLSRRDIVERSLFIKATELGIPILGICRGAQLACSLNGGSLVQHVDNHTRGQHRIELENGTFIPTNSLHHQMMVPWKTNHELLGWSKEPLSPRYLGENNQEIDMKCEPEIVWFKDSNTLAIQGHPEWLPFSHPLVKYMIQQFKERL